MWGQQEGYPCPAGSSSGMQVELGHIQPVGGVWPWVEGWYWPREGTCGSGARRVLQGGAGTLWQGFFSPLTVLGIWLAPFMFMSNRT